MAHPSSTGTYILGGWQSDFSHQWGDDAVREMLTQATMQSLEAADVVPADIDVIHVGNLASEIFVAQAHLGALAATIDPAFVGLPTSRHEAACASGSVAALSAMAELEASRYRIALVLGVEVMRNVPGQEAGEILGCAAYRGHEAIGEKYPWPYLFAKVADEYGRRYGLDHKHLARIAEVNIGNAKANPNAQTRDWSFPVGSFGSDEAVNPVVEGILRKNDCGRITDGCAGVVLASASAAAEHCRIRGIKIADLPVISGWGHTTAPIALQDKLDLAVEEPLVFPHLRKAIVDAQQRAGIHSIEEFDVFEVHDCFSISEYVAIDHLGITPPGESWKAVEEGSIEIDGKLPVNPSGGLLGLGHPVGATGVRMLVDAAKQVTGRAEGYQVSGAKTVGTLNIGGSFSSVVSFVVNRPLL